MSNKTTWIVVANNAQARIFRLVKFPKIEEFAALEHPESRLQNHELVSARPGRTAQKGGTRRHAYEAESDPHQLEMDKFAQQVSHYLKEAHQKKEFSRFYLFASPSFLGLLRQHMDPQMQEAIIAEIPKDMVRQQQSDIEEHLFEE